MSAAYRCDRCDEFTADSKYARKVSSWKDMDPNALEVADYVVELCHACARDFERWTEPPPRAAKP